MYNPERQLWYLHLLTKHCPCNLLPQSTSPKHEYRGKLWGHPLTSSMTSSPWKTFLGIIWNGLFISEVKLKLCLIFQNFYNSHHFELATNFFTEVIAFPIFWAFDRRSSSNIDGDISISKFEVLLWPGDVINDVMNMYLYKCSHNLMILTHRNFNDEIFAHFLVITKNVISFIKEYRGPTLRLPCDVITMKKLFLA